VQHANPAVGGFTGEGFVAHAAGVDGGVSIGTVNLHGQGDVHIFLDTQAIGTINQDPGVNLVDLHYQLADLDSAGIGSGARVTAINGFSADHDAVIFNGGAAGAANFAALPGSYADLAAMNADINTRLDGTVKYVFAVYGGAADINGDGRVDTNSGVLAWDDDGIGMTAVLLTPGVTTMAPADLS
jgi:hypothetical protein